MTFGKLTNLLYITLIIWHKLFPPSSSIVQFIQGYSQKGLSINTDIQISRPFHKIYSLSRISE